MIKETRVLVKYLCICAVVAGFFCRECAGMASREEPAPAGVCAVQEQFSRGQYRQALQSCQALMESTAGCPAQDRALYYAALCSLRLQPGEAGRQQAAGYLSRLVAQCPQSPLRLEAETWLAAITGFSGRSGNGERPADNDTAQASSEHEERQTGKAQHDVLKKKNQEIKRLRSEITRLNHEIDLLKNVDVQLHQKKKDIDNEPDEGKDPGR